MAEITLRGVTKVFADRTEAVHELDLDVPDGKLIVLVGPSGCGKTTVLRMIAGLEDLTDGTIAIGDRVVNQVPPGDRDIAMVFQNYALYPHMTVYQNMALSLKIRKLKKEEIRRRVSDAADVLHLQEFLQKRPRELSGGQRQRVAMGRAIVREPQAFLMDEPLSNLDAKLRVQMRAEILRIQKDLKVTTVYVTHDQTEAMTLGDLVVVLRKGELQQVGSPEELYERPANLFVGGFIGSPAMNLVEATVTRDDNGTSVVFAGHRLLVPPAVLDARPELAGFDGRATILGIRPEDMEDAALVPGSDPASRLPVAVALREGMGSDVFLHFQIDAPPVMTEDTRELASDVGDKAVQELQEQASERRATFIARVGPESRASLGSQVELHVDTRKLYFFDPASGRSIGEGREAAPVHAAGALAD
ncbi:MAG TPA: sn-glycerol-3-phosphate ABC transporter ATP-binding protein UgpC [Actinomycetota bacterium]|nr:sn-glycerol-3-phosphate ABC transporter ATP-binding protein UgpC [Actinomycetota bacterium]